jgi:hypothetical protein
MSREAIDEREETEGRRKGVPIFINKEKFTVEMPVTGARLRELGEIPAGNQLFLDVPGTTQDQLIRPDESYTLKPGSHLYDLPVGSVGASSLELQVEYVRAHLGGATVARQADGVTVIRWPLDLQAPWTPTSATLIVLLPPLYPAQAPSGFDSLGPITLAGAGVGGTGLRQVGPEQWSHYCWNPAGALDYTAEDGVWRFAKFAESRFLQLQ